MPKIDISKYLEQKNLNLVFNVGKLMASISNTKVPHLATILIGDRKDSQVYVKNKEKAIEKACMTSETINISDGTSIIEIATRITQLNDNPNINGILIQLPLNREFYSKKDEDMFISLISPLKDVDGLTLINQGKMFIGENQNTFLTPCTPTGIIQLLKHQYDYLIALDITIVGRSQLLGNSLAQMLMRENANVTMLHSKSGWIMEDYMNMNAVDVICLCAGSNDLLKASDLSPNTSYTIIDAAINVGEDGKLRGDFKKEDYSLLDDTADSNYEIDYTSVPGGVGPITTFTLAYNLYKATCLQNSIEIESI